MPRPLQLDKAGKLKLSEADVVRQVCDFLEAHGWRILRTGYGEIRQGISTVTGVERVVDTVGEVGQSDYQAIRYKAGCYCELLWLEFKKPKSKGDSGGKLRKSQVTWMAIEQARGATVLVVDDLVKFLDWYRRAGLAKLPAKVAEVGR